MVVCGLNEWVTLLFYPGGLNDGIILDSIAIEDIISKISLPLKKYFLLSYE